MRSQSNQTARPDIELPGPPPRLIQTSRTPVRDIPRMPAQTSKVAPPSRGRHQMDDQASDEKKPRRSISLADTHDPPPSYRSQPRPLVPSRARVIAVLHAMQQTPSMSIISAIQKEPFDPLHDFKPRDVRRGRFHVKGSTHPCKDYLCLGVIALALLALFGAFPVLRYFLALRYNLALSARLMGPSGTKVVPDFALDRLSLVDRDTPANVRTRKGYDGKTYQLVFSDEFNVDGRTFAPGDDPFWTAFSGWNAGTKDLQWYDYGQVQTSNGSLVIQIEETPKARKAETNLSYISGQLTTWNQFCFTGGYVEVRASLPGNNKGFWPAVWLLGNLGRAGYGSTLDGTWPYVYNACDVGTLKGQTPHGSDQVVANALTGQRLSACTCPQADHPGPVSDGRYVGRMAPEIDVFEGYVDTNGGAFSNALPMAPFDAKEAWTANQETYAIYNNDFSTQLNGFGGTMQAEYAVTRSQMDQKIWGADYGTWGVEWVPTFFDDEGQLTWQHEGQALWSINSKAFAPDPSTFISQRQISGEASQIIINVAMSETWHTVNLSSLTFPAQMRIDYVRVYQRGDRIDLTCDPKRAPTADYIQRHIDAYSDAQLLYWSQVPSGRTYPPNSLVDTCAT